MPKISVIIPNYNRANVIGYTIEAILNQSLKPHEIIVVDDGSTDNSIEVLQQFGDKIKLLTQENKGPSAARNKGVLESSGEFVQFMDSDDIPSLNKLEVQSKVALQANADIVIGPWVRGWFNEKTFTPENIVLQTQPLPKKRTVLEWFLTDWSMVFQQALVRKDLLIEVGLYNEEMIVMEDGDLFVKLLLAKAKVVFEQESLTLYRLGSEDKLTNQGSSIKHKLVDHFTFYKLLFSYANTLKIYRNIDFQLKLYKLVVELKRFQIDTKELHPFMYTTPIVLKLYALKKRISLGLKHRIKGHRWSKTYCPSRITDLQKALIEKLGYKLL